MDKLLEEILKKLDSDNLKELLKKHESQEKYNCEIRITKKGVNTKTEINGNALMALITLKSVLKSFQKELEVSDKELDELMEGVHVIDGERGIF